MLDLWGLYSHTYTSHGHCKKNVFYERSKSVFSFDLSGFLLLNNYLKHLFYFSLKVIT